MKLLLVEDDPEVARAISGLLADHYLLETASTGKEALSKATVNEYDLVVLDLGLPDMGGLDVCKKLRERNFVAPILILTGMFQGPEHVANGLDCGADDYLTKPFDNSELLARIRSLLRRSGSELKKEHIVLGDLVIDLAGRTAVRSGKNIDLRRKEYDLLEYMARNPNRVLTRQMIFDHVWDSDANTFNNTVDVHVKYLRDKVDRTYARKLIKTIHGLGYKLEANEEGGEKNGKDDRKIINR